MQEITTITIELPLAQAKVALSAVEANANRMLLDPDLDNGTWTDAFRAAYQTIDAARFTLQQAVNAAEAPKPEPQTGEDWDGDLNDI